MKSGEVKPFHKAHGINVVTSEPRDNMEWEVLPSTRPRPEGEDERPKVRVVASTEPEPDAFTKLTTDELKTLLKVANLPVNGNREEMLERLRQAAAQRDSRRRA